MYRGTIYIDSLQKNQLLEYLEDTGWIIEEDEVFKRKGIRVITLSNDYNEITVQFEKHQKIEIDDRESVLTEIDAHFNGNSTLLRTDN